MLVQNFRIERRNWVDVIQHIFETGIRSFDMSISSSVCCGHGVQIIGVKCE